MKTKTSFKKDAFRDAILMLLPEKDPDVNSVTRAIHASQSFATGSNANNHRRKEPQENLARARTGHAEPPALTNLETEYKNAKKGCRTAILRSKKLHWKSLCDQLENDVWGQGYKLVTRQLKGPIVQFNLSSGEKDLVVAKLFPRKADWWCRDTKRYSPEPITINEIQEAARKLKAGKAPGPDKITPEEVKESLTAAPDTILCLMNTIISSQTFPSKSKKANVTLISKGSADEDKVSYRPICLLDSQGKLYEHVIKARFEHEMEERGALTYNTQYGFRKGRSTIDAVKRVLSLANDGHRKWAAAVMIDVPSSRSLSPHKYIFFEVKGHTPKKMEMRQAGPPFTLPDSGMKQIVETLFPDRSENLLTPIYTSEIPLFRTQEIATAAAKLKVRKASGPDGIPPEVIKRLAKDEPTILRDLYNNSLTRQEFPTSWKLIKVVLIHKSGTSVVGYADDVAIVVQGENKQKLTLNANHALQQVVKWLQANNLELAVEKTEGVILSGRRNRQDIQINVNDQSGLAKGNQEVSVSRKTNAKLQRSKYGKEGDIVWSCAVHNCVCRTYMESCNEDKDIPTVSSAAVQVITGFPPVDLIVEERRYAAQEGSGPGAKQRAKERTNQECIDKWRRCRHRQLDYHFTQVLTGHGHFKVYTNRLGKTDTKCFYCDREDSAEHTLISCLRWTTQRLRICETLGGEPEALTPASVVEGMLDTAEKWGAIQKCIIDIMKSKSVELAGGDG
ncbi:uncharacterized protein LOC132702359 [Cylas formicarius]|uniref:uncharacterized protein LOC132702359 n=1 Tax=Cylas formicarius TaxID=197179 RepID=UPI0029588FCA|nr:uncharacterized protein LOC132702359 [Cylas formicarius]